MTPRLGRTGIAASAALFAVPPADHADTVCKAIHCNVSVMPYNRLLDRKVGEVEVAVKSRLTSDDCLLGRTKSTFLDIVPLLGTTLWSA